MRCVAFCTAQSYMINAVATYYKRNNYQTKLFRNVLHLNKPEQRGDIFCFPQGCVVIWGLHRKEELLIVEQLKKFSTNPLEKIEVDTFCYRIGEETTISVHERFNVDIIELELNNVMMKLAISYGLAQSMKLASYEESIRNTISVNEKLPEELATKGKIKLSRRAISKRMGEIFRDMSYINLSSEYLEMPEYFWQYPSLEANYVMTEKYLDVPRRAAALNRKLNVLHELIQMLNSQLEHRYASLLETIIIVLIIAEIFISVFHWQLM